MRELVSMYSFGWSARSERSGRMMEFASFPCDQLNSIRSLGAATTCAPEKKTVSLSSAMAIDAAEGRG